MPPQSDHAVNDYPGFRDYLEDLWYHRSPKEWEILLRCAGQTAVSHNATLTDDGNVVLPTDLVDLVYL